MRVELLNGANVAREGSQGERGSGRRRRGMPHTHSLSRTHTVSLFILSLILNNYAVAAQITTNTHRVAVAVTVAVTVLGGPCVTSQEQGRGQGVRYSCLHLLINCLTACQPALFSRNSSCRATNCSHFNVFDVSASLPVPMPHFLATCVSS